MASLASAAPASLRAPGGGLRGNGVRIAWLLLALGAIVFSLTAPAWLPAAVEYPKAWVVPVRPWITAFGKWLVNSASFGLFSFHELTRFVAAILEVPYDAVLAVLATGVRAGPGTDAAVLVPPLSWLAVVALAFAAGTWAKNWRLGLFAALAFLYLALFGQWQQAMVTLASIVVAVPIGVAGGLLVGLAGFRWPRFERAMTPVLDLMQTVPVFAYLVPILVLFGFGPVAAIIATVIYAMPPMVRTTLIGLRGVPAEVSDLGRMIGCTRRQMTWKVMVPAALPTLMIGVNQVIMLSLNMVIIASMIGAGGLGFDVLASLRKLDIGGGLEAGIAIVVLAVALDRLSQALARREADLVTGGRPRHRDPLVLAALAVALVAAAGAFVWPPLAAYPPELTVTTGPFWSAAIAWINVNFFDALEAAKNLVLLNLLIPVKRFLLGVPWSVAVVLVAAAGLTLGGWRLALLAGLLTLAIAAAGLWEEAMVTVYLCGISVIIASAIGIPVGIAAASRPRLWRVVQAVIDTLQTLPSFVYLIPVVMLFRVGDFSAMIAVVAYAVVPAIRYTAAGLRQVNEELVEAGIAAGCTPRQLLRKVKLRLALPEIMLGINQTIMLALSMLVITALVGTRDLGQEVYSALAKADLGRGIVAGLAVAFIAIIADRLITAAAARDRARPAGGGH